MSFEGPEDIKNTVSCSHQQIPIFGSFCRVSNDAGNTVMSPDNTVMYGIRNNRAAE